MKLGCCLLVEQHVCLRLSDQIPFHLLHKVIVDNVPRVIGGPDVYDKVSSLSVRAVMLDYSIQLVLCATCLEERLEAYVTVDLDGGASAFAEAEAQELHAQYAWSVCNRVLSGCLAPAT